MAIIVGELIEKDGKFLLVQEAKNNIIKNVKQDKTLEIAAIKQKIWCAYSIFEKNSV